MWLIRLRETDVSTVESDNLHFGYRTQAHYVYKYTYYIWY